MYPSVVYFVPPETFLNDIVSSIQVSANSRAYMINKTGDTIADITLEPMHADTLIDDCPLFLHRYRCIRKLWDTSCVHRYIFISSQLLFNTLRRQDCGFAHHLFHCHDSAPVIQGNTGKMSLFAGKY